MNDQAEQQETRPRFGTLHRADGTSAPIVFLPTADPMRFRGVNAGDEQPVQVGPGDSFTIDVLGEGQSAYLQLAPGWDPAMD